MKILSALADTEQEPSLTEGIKLLAGEQPTQVEAVEVSGWRLDKLGKWSNEAQKLLFEIAHRHFDVVRLTMPTKRYGKVSLHQQRRSCATAQSVVPVRLPLAHAAGKKSSGHGHY